MTDPSTPVSIASWNALAARFAKPERYPDVPPFLLKYDVRYPRTVAAVAAFDRDVICLQEVDVKLYEMLCDALWKRGYQSEWAPMKSTLVGCATFWRSTLRWRRNDLHWYCDGGGRRELTGHVALISTFAIDPRPDKERERAPLPDGENTFIVANTHLIWDDPDADPSQWHAERQSSELVSFLKENQHLPTIICGDFNAEPGSKVISPFLRAGFGDAHDVRTHTFNRPEKRTPGLQRARKIDFMLYRGTLRVDAESPALDDSTILPSLAVPSDHLPLFGTFRI
ncbi:MAG: hypothetical protein RLZZ324_822 [Candidatus Parcubacteria bacterium]|jgi:mRNA deadenylase 3'-5' endonuclease subunit Ccr4